MSKFDLSEHPHRRYNLLTGEWILVSPHRAKRPWQGQVEDPPDTERLKYDPSCYLCPGNDRAGRKRNPDYEGTFVFTNDFSALQTGNPAGELNKNNLLMAQGETGECRVICFSPRHDLTLPEMSIEEIGKVVDIWTEQYKALGSQDYINYVQIFENKGAIMGCSNPHPHGQIWAQQSIPVEPAKELFQMLQYLKTHEECLLCDYLNLELEISNRIVLQNKHFIALVPFWAVWPFETMILSRRHIANLSDTTSIERRSLAEIIRKLTIKYDNLFRISFPYSAGLHQSPTDGLDHPEWHFHMHFYPPLLRSASVKKFMVGYEMLANPQRDITAEWSADKLAALSDNHYKLDKK